MHKKIGIFLTLFLLFAFFAQPALAVSYDEVEADHVRVNRGSVIKKIQVFLGL